MLSHLHPSLDPRALHPAGNVDGVAPNVIVELGRPDDAGGHVAKVEADAENEVELDQALWNGDSGQSLSWFQWHSEVYRDRLKGGP